MLKKAPVKLMAGILSLALLSGCSGGGDSTTAGTGEVTTPLDVNTATPEELTLPFGSDDSQLTIASIPHSAYRDEFF